MHKVLKTMAVYKTIPCFIETKLESILFQSINIDNILMNKILLICISPQLKAAVYEVINCFRFSKELASLTLLYFTLPVFRCSEPVRRSAK